jgi:hypothetical protein
MEPDNWKAILNRRDIDHHLFGEHASTACYFALGLKLATRNEPRYDVSKIPDEEVITLLTIRQLAGLAKGPNVRQSTPGKRMRARARRVSA